MEPITARRVYLWFDTEFTDLDPAKSHLLQVALVATDENLQRLRPADEDLCLIIRLDEDTETSPWVNANLQELLGRCRSEEAIGVDEADQRLVDYVDAIAGPPAEAVNQRPILAGNSVYADLTMARKWLPGFAQRLHYRLVDVSTMKTLWEDWKGDELFDKDNALMLKSYFPGDESDFSARPHDAYYDILASIAELNFYRKKMGI